MDSKFSFEQGKDYYLEKGEIILTEGYLSKRGKCCGGKCRHCPFYPQFVKGNTIIKEKK